MHVYFREFVSLECIMDYSRMPFFVLSGCINFLLLDDKEDTCKAGSCHTPFWLFFA